MTPPPRAEERLEALRVAAGPDVDASRIARVAGSVDQWNAQPGEALVVEGQRARQGFVVVTGSATVRMDGVEVARLGPGSAIWPPATSDTSPASVIADETMWLLVLAPSEQAILRGTRPGTRE